MRYAYIPLGGNRVSFLRRIINIFIIFNFVIFAHAPTVVTDIHIMVWGWAMTLFMVPEIIAVMISHKLGMENWPSFRHIAALGGALNIFILVLVNLCGFGFRTKNPVLTIQSVLLDFVGHIFSVRNWQSLLFIFSVVYVYANLMIIQRRIENSTPKKINVD